MDRNRTTAVLACFLLTACGSSGPEAPQRSQIVADARSALAAIPPTSVQRLDARIRLAHGLASEDSGESAAELLDGAEAEIDAWPEGFGASYKTLGQARVSAERSSLGIGEPLKGDTELARFSSLAAGEETAIALLEAARVYADAGISDVMLTMLDEAARATAEVGALARRSWLYRQLLDEYVRVGAEEQMAEVLYGAEEAAWLEDDASQQPVALMRLAAVYARLGRNEEAEAIKAALPENFHPDIDAAKAVALSAQGRVDAARSAAAAIGHPQSRAQAFIGILEQLPAAGSKASIANSASEALAASDESSRSIQYYAIARALLPEHPGLARENLQRAVDLNRASGRFWNFDAFSAASIALADAGALAESRALAAQVMDDTQRRHLEAKLTAVAARRAARDGDRGTAYTLATSLEEPAARAIALAGVLEETK